jgi:hypothetical protein
VHACTEVLAGRTAPAVQGAAGASAAGQAALRQMRAAHGRRWKL